MASIKVRRYPAFNWLVLIHFSVSDVFHTASPESPLWEFKHGGGNFRRGDMLGLREIKRRASRHALVHRNEQQTLAAPKQPGSASGSGAEPMPTHAMQSIQESTDSRFANLEHTLYDIHARLARSEENSQVLQMRNQFTMDALSRSFQVSPLSTSSLNHPLIWCQLNQEMARMMLSLVSSPEMPIYRDSMFSFHVFADH